MDREGEKIRAIVNELVSYSLQNGATFIEINIRKDTENKIIEVTFNPKSVEEKKINELRKVLNVPRSAELEEYYWRVLGDGGDESSFFMIGIMVNTFKLDYDEQLGLKVTLYRKN